MAPRVEAVIGHVVDLADAVNSRPRRRPTKTLPALLKSGLDSTMTLVIRPRRHYGVGGQVMPARVTYNSSTKA
jgi:hypothetical protein